MKWLFLVNDAQFLMEFLGKVANQLVKEGDECLVVFSSKISEYNRKKFFPKQAKFISKVDWCLENYDEKKEALGSLTWREFFPIYERFKALNFTYKKSISAIKQAYQFFEYIFDEEKPDAVVSEPPAGLFGEIAFYFAKQRKVPYAGFMESRINGKLDLYDSEFTSSLYEKEFELIKNGQSLPTKEEADFAGAFINKFVSHKEKPSYVKWIKISFGVFSFFAHYFRKLFEVGGPIFKYISQRNKIKNFDYESEFLAKYNLLSPFRSIKRNLKIKYQRRFFDSPDAGGKYFLFPMQLEPEASTLVMATYYSIQVNTIKYAAFCLPLPYKLYVKEHPDAIGTKPNSFYKELKKLPNVIVLAPETNMPDLIKNSAGVITPTSTVGMEAALMGKPVYVLGNVFYTYHPAVRKVNNFDHLKEQALQDVLNGAGINNIDFASKAFMVSYYRHSLEGSIAFASMPEDQNNYAKITEGLKEFLKKIKS